MFPPSDSHSLENNDSDNANGNGKGTSTALAEESRAADGLIPFNGGLAPAGVAPWGLGFPTRPEILSAKPDFSNLLNCLRRRKWLAIFLGLILGGALGGLCWYEFPPRYDSSAYVRVSIVDPAVWEQHSGIDFESYKRNMIETIKSPVVLGKAVEDRSIQDFPLYRKNSVDPVNWLADVLQVTGGNGELIHISLRNDEPQGLKEIVDAVVGAFKDEVIERARTEKLNDVDSLERKVKSYQTQVSDKEKALYNLTQQIGTSDAQTAKVQYKMQVDELDTLMRARTDIRRQLTDLEFKLSLFKIKKDLAEKNSVPEEEIEAAISRDPQIQQMYVELGQLMREKSGVEKVIKKHSDPNYIAMQEQIASLKQSIDEAKSTARQQVKDQLMRSGEGSSAAMTEGIAEHQLLEAQFNQITDSINKKAGEVQQLEKFTGDAEQLRREKDELQAILHDMGITLQKRKIELDAAPRVSIYQGASTPMVEKPTKQYIFTGFAALFGFGLAIVGVTFLEFLSRKLNAAHELNVGLGIRVMGDLPNLRRRGLRPRSRQATHGLVAESINGIRATLMRNASAGSSNVFLVTSAGEQEGKTTVSSQLAASLARAGRKTLLIDADLRHPGAHLVFGLDNEEGFCELLRGEVDADEVIRPTPADNLWMVSAGRCCATAVMALGKEKVAEVIGQLEARFEFIVIDTGPVLKVADALLLGAHVDGAILSVLRDHSRINKVYEANERLKLAGVNVVGAVVNGIEDRGRRFDRYHVVEAPAA